jgi:hypothetical protein
MSGGFLRIRFIADDDGTGELIVHAESDSFSGTGRAYFDIRAIEAFAAAIATISTFERGAPNDRRWLLGNRSSR